MRAEARLALVALGLAVASPAQAERVALDPGQPVCADQDSLREMLTAAVQGKRASVPCEGARKGDVAEVVERYPTGADGVRVVKVKVGTPGHAPVVGYTLEVTRP